jgi:hypothetical protein
MKIENRDGRQVIELADGEKALLTFESTQRNLLISCNNGTIVSSWSGEDAPRVRPNGWIVEAGSERDYADLIDRQDGNLIDGFN